MRTYCVRESIPNLFLLMFIFAWPTIVKAQQAKSADLFFVRNVLEQFTNQEKIDMQVNYQLYASPEGGEPIQQSGYRLQRNKNFYRMSLYGFYEVCSNKEYTLFIDHTTKRVHLDTVVAFSFKKQKWHIPENETGQLQKTLDSLLRSRSDRVIVKSISEQFNQIEIASEFGKFTKIILRVDSKKYTLKQATLYLREKMKLNNNVAADYPRLEVHYQKFDNNPNFSNETFGLGDILSRVYGQWSLTGSCTNYHLVNHIE